MIDSMIASPPPLMDNPWEISLMIHLMSVAILLVAGLVLGGLYFGGLWMTLRRLPRWRRPFLGVGVSVLVRLTVLLGLGGLLLRYPIASPLQTILLMAVGVWLSRMVLITLLLKTLEPVSTHPIGSP
ncbi:MAG: ATP synthase subunit I [Cyanobacteria bacterium J06635_1]